MNNVNRLPDCYRKDTAGNNFKLLEINQQAAKELKEDIQTLREVLNLNSACGKSLDLYGGTLGRQRGRMTDSQYRYALYAQIGRNNVTGDYESIVGALVMMFGLDIGQITPNDFELVEDRERCLVQLKKYPEVLEAAGFEIREIYQMIKNLLPVCVPLLIQFYYWFHVFVRYENIMHIFAGFYPRYNLAHHLWEGEHLLDGGKYLNGYDSAALVDFYPVVQVISVDVLPGVKEEPILCSTVDVCCKTAMDVENTVLADVVEDVGLAAGTWAAGDLDVLPEEAVRIVVMQGTAIKTKYVTASGFHADVPKNIMIAGNQLLGSIAEVLSEQRTSMGFKAGVAEPVISEANGTYYRAEASAAPKAVGTGTVGAAYPVGADYQNKLTVEKNLRYLEGMRTLSGAGLLNAEIISYTL